MVGVSPTTVRRWVAIGKLRSQRFDRPQGEGVRVFVGPENIDAAPVACEQVSEPQLSTDAPPHTEGQIPTNAPSALTIWSETVLAPLVETIRSQAETIGTLRAERDAARVEIERATPLINALSGRLEEATAMVEVLRAELQAAHAPTLPPEASTATIPAEPVADAPTDFRGFSMPGWMLPTLAMVIVVIGVLLTMPR
jgi:hypothetical protein